MAIVDLEDKQEYSRQSLNHDSLAMVKLALKIQAAHDYSLRLGRRMEAHWQQAFERGRHGKVMRGRGGKHPSWLEVGEDGQWRLNDHAETIRLIFRLAEEMGSARIARELEARGIPNPSGKRWWATAVARLLHEPAVHGTLELGRGARRSTRRDGEALANEPLAEVIEGYYPAAVDRATFDRIQRVMERRFHDRAAKGWKFDGVMRTWLQGLIFCQHGSPMSASMDWSRGKDGSQYVYIRCRARRYGGGCRCNGKGWRAEQVHSHILKRIPRLFQALVALAAQGREGEEEVLRQRQHVAQRRLEEAQGRLRNVMQSLDAAMEEARSVSLLERLNAKVEYEEGEVRKAQAAADAAIADLDDFRRRPDPASLLSGQEGRVPGLLAALAVGAGTAEQRRRMNKLLRQVELRVILDDSSKQEPRIGLALGTMTEPLWHPFGGEVELVGLAALLGALPGTDNTGDQTVPYFMPDPF